MRLSMSRAVVYTPAVPPPRPALDPASLLAEPPLRTIVRLATPTTLVMLLASTANVLYTYFVSRLGTDAIAAVSLVLPISLLLTTAMNGGLGAGAASAVARALGAGQRREAARLAEHAVVLAIVLGVVVALGVLVAAPVVFTGLGGRGSVLDGAVTFARVLFGGAVITFTIGMLDSVMRGEGNVRIPSIWSSVSLALQIVLTPLLMFGAGLGLVGAPLAMLSGQLVAVLPRAMHVYGGHGVVQPHVRPRGLAPGPLVEILRVGIPAALSTTIVYIGVMVLTGIMARLGEEHLAAYGLGTRLDFLLLSFAYGFGAAVLTMVGLATGARRPELARRYVWRAGLIIVAIVSVPAAILCWRPTLWLGLFTTDPAIQEVGAHYFRVIGPSYPLLGIAMVTSFAFQALGRATLPLVWMVIRVTGVLVAALVCTRRYGLGDDAVFAVVAIGNAASAVVMVGLFARAERGIAASARART